MCCVCVSVYMPCMFTCVSTLMHVVYAHMSCCGVWAHAIHVMCAACMHVAHDLPLQLFICTHVTRHVFACVYTCVCNHANCSEYLCVWYAFPCVSMHAIEHPCVHVSCMFVFVHACLCTCTWRGHLSLHCPTVLMCHVFPHVGVADVHTCLYTVVCLCPSLLTCVPCAGCAFRVQLHQDIRKVAASPREARGCCAVNPGVLDALPPLGPSKALWAQGDSPRHCVFC